MHAVITGGASGLGRATAQALSAAGAAVAVLDADYEGAQRVVRDLGDAAVALQVDVSDPAAVEFGINGALTRWGRIDVCVNAAGVVTAGGITDGTSPLDLAQFRRVIDINLVGTFDVMRHCVTAMTANEPVDGERGVVINVSSAAAWQGQRGQVAYAASKAGIIGLTLPAARDLAPLGIRVVAIAPGLFDTEMARGLPPKVAEGLKKMILHPARLGDPGEFAALVEHIIRNPYFNATTISLDAGTRLT
jgi:3-hydroxyacyl-CoA dehydrogenase/3-hydroxy-2-methylbutyryl-CoA dehydrogenase